MDLTCAPYAQMVGRPLREDEMWAYTGDLQSGSGAGAGPSFREDEMWAYTGDLQSGAGAGAGPSFREDEIGRCTIMLIVLPFAPSPHPLF